MIVKTKISVKLKVEEGWYSEQEMEEDLHWPETLRTKLHKPPKHVLYPKQTLSTKEEAEGSNPGLLGRGAKLLQVGTVGVVYRFQVLGSPKPPIPKDPGPFILSLSPSMMYLCQSLPTGRIDMTVRWSTGWW